jgi:hypothetical protein
MNFMTTFTATIAIICLPLVPGTLCAITLCTLSLMNHELYNNRSN